MATPADALRSVPFLSGVDERDLADLAASMREREISAGEDIVTQGTGGIAFFVILEGEATVTVDGAERRTLSSGEHFGEVALVAPDLPRSSSVVAKTDARVAGLTAWKFKPFVLEHPEVAWSLLETLARRLADAPGA